MHPGGFEPPTARFVAEYSIQLSYGCIGITALLLISNTAFEALPDKRGYIQEDDALRAVADATLSSLVLAIIAQTMKQQY